MQTEIRHFPKSIPDNAKDVQMYCWPGSFERDSELFLLKFKTNQSYVREELKKNKFLNEKTPVGAKQKIYNMPSEFVGINEHELTYYVLNNIGNHNEDSEYFPYYTGIGVDKSLNTILYYYIAPD